MKSILLTIEQCTMVSPFSKLFGKAPFQPLFDHMETVFSCARELPDFFQATQEQNWEAAKNIQKTIHLWEKQADSLKQDLRLNLPGNLFMPIARTDILELISAQDQIANYTKRITGLVIARQMHLPSTIQKEFPAFLLRCLDACKQAFKATRELNDLYAAGFSGREKEIMHNMVEQLHQIERDTDELEMSLRHNLFKMEQELPPVDAIFLYKIIEWTSQLADYAQRVGDRLLICIAK